MTASSRRAGKADLQTWFARERQADLHVDLGKHVRSEPFVVGEVTRLDVAVRVEYDTEKWNAGIGVGLKYGLRLRVAALNMEGLSVGAGWYHEL